MRAHTTDLPGVMLLEPTVFEDDRGHFFEAYTERAFAELTGIDETFVQDNQSRSHRGVLRGLHYQLEPRSQGKLVRTIHGSIWDVAVDLRRSSASFLSWCGYEISSTNRRQLWIPPGFGHGFVALTEYADVLYKTTDFYAPEFDRSLRWNDPAVGIDWPVDGLRVQTSEKDRTAPLLADADVFE